MNSPAPIEEHSDILRPKSASPEIPRIIRVHFPADHLISQDRLQKCQNKIQYDRSLTEFEKHRLQGHADHVEQYGLMMDQEVPEGEEHAWEWVRPYLRKEENGDQ